VQVSVRVHIEIGSDPSLVFENLVAAAAIFELRKNKEF
jgi:hypothetical protein